MNDKADLKRTDDRAADALRPLVLTPDWLRHAEGSVLISQGHTRVLCVVSVEEGVPSFLKGQGQGWLTSEYGMLPRSTHTRMRREAADGKLSGRTQEIQRLIGRSLRAVTDLTKLGERTLRIDCDVLQADGGTRCASITGAWLALACAVHRLQRAGVLTQSPLRDHVAAVSVGIVGGAARLDLDYVEDSGCDTDMNVVMTGSGHFVEVQGTAEGNPFSDGEMQELLTLARRGIGQLIDAQKAALADVYKK